MPVRNVMEEMCPSPVARRLRMKRSAPAGRSGLVGVRNDGRIEQRSGFQRIFGQEIGADQQPSLFGQFLIRQQQLATCSKRSRKSLWISWCRWENSAETSSSSGPTRSSGSAMILAMILATRSGSPGTERPQQHARLVGLEDRARAFDVN